VMLHTLGRLLGSPGATLKLHAIDPLPEAPQSETVLVALSPTPRKDSQRFVLALPLVAARRIVDRILQRSKFREKGILSSGEQGALLYALDRAGGDWIRAGGRPFVIRGFLADRDQVFDYLPPKPCLRAVGSIENPGFPEFKIDLWLPLPPSPGSPVSPLKKNKMFFNPAARDLPVSLHISVGVSSLSLADIRNLQPEDLVILDRVDHPLLRSSLAGTVIYAGNWSRQCRWQDSQTLIIVDAESRDEPMDTDTKNSTTIVSELNNSANDDTGEIEIVVRVEIGHIKMAVAEAATLLPGTILRLDRDVGPRVSLRAGEKRIANGDLVEYEGQLAVEIKEVL